MGHHNATNTVGCEGTGLPAICQGKLGNLIKETWTKAQCTFYRGTQVFFEFKKESIKSSSHKWTRTFYRYYVHRHKLQSDCCKIPKIILVPGFCALEADIARFLIGFRLKTTSLSCSLTTLSCFHGSVLCSVLMYDLKLRNSTPTLSPNRKQFVSKVLPQLAGLQELAREKEMGGSDVSVANAGDIEKGLVKDESRDSDDRKEAIKRLKTSE